MAGSQTQSDPSSVPSLFSMTLVAMLTIFLVTQKVVADKPL